MPHYLLQSAKQAKANDRIAAILIGCIIKQTHFSIQIFKYIQEDCILNTKTLKIQQLFWYELGGVIMKF